eukprot:scaffold2835_cov105-Isochrysis_galbana.AAC.8
MAGSRVRRWEMMGEGVRWREMAGDDGRWCEMVGDGERRCEMVGDGVRRVLRVKPAQELQVATARRLVAQHQLRGLPNGLRAGQVYLNTGRSAQRVVQEQLRGSEKAVCPPAPIHG